MNLKNNKLIKNLRDLKALCLSYESNNKKIVMTNGCFDILHAGHTYILEESRKLGDILIIALNSDLSVKKIITQMKKSVKDLGMALLQVKKIVKLDQDIPTDYAYIIYTRYTVIID